MSNKQVSRLSGRSGNYEYRVYSPITASRLVDKNVNVPVPRPVPTRDRHVPKEMLSVPIERCIRA